MEENPYNTSGHLPTHRRKLYTTLIWTYIVCIYLVSCIIDDLILLLLAMVLPFIVVVLRYPTQVKLLMFPKTLRRWFLASKIIIACKGPQYNSKLEKKLSWKQQIPAAILLSNLFPVILLISLSDVFYTPILDLKEHDFYEGTIEKVVNSRKGRRSDKVSKLWLNTLNGRTLKFYGVGRSADVKYLKALGHDKLIKIWSQHQWGITPFSHRQFVHQLEHNGFFIKKYNKNILLKNIPKTKKLFYIILSYFVISMIYLWLKGNSYIKMRNQNL